MLTTATFLPALNPFELGITLDSILQWLSWQAFVATFLGIAIGIFVGAVPGLTGTMGLALVLPFTLYLNTAVALGLLLGVYKGGMFGGAIAAIAFGIPGTPSSAPTVFDGYELTKQGKPKKALEAAHFAGVSADFLSDAVLIVTFAPLALLALKFGPRELTALLIIAMALLAVFAGRSIGKALIALGIGMVLGAVGPDPIGGVARMHFGLYELRGGIGLVPLLVGLFAMSGLMMQSYEMLAHRRRARLDEADDESGLDIASVFDAHNADDHLTFKEYRSGWREILIGAGFGTFVGAVPGPGAVLASFASYGFAGRLKRNQATWGKGNFRGVMAAEAADSATAGATLIPLFGLGIPGSAMAAVFAVALMIQGVNPGPTMLRTQGGLIYAFFALLMFGSASMLIIGHYAVPFYGKIAKLKNEFMVPLLTLVCVLGVYAIAVSRFAVLIMVGAGILGIVLKQFDVPVGAVIVAYIVSPLLEGSLRRGILIGRGSLAYFFSTPISRGLYVVAAVVVILIVRSRLKALRKDDAAIIEAGI